MTAEAAGSPLHDPSGRLTTCPASLAARLASENPPIAPRCGLPGALCAAPPRDPWDGSRFRSGQLPARPWALAPPAMLPLRLAAAEGARWPLRGVLVAGASRNQPPDIGAPAAVGRGVVRP